MGSGLDICISLLLALALSLLLHSAAVWHAGTPAPPPAIVVFGGASVDVLTVAGAAGEKKNGSISVSWGGVGRNVAEAAQRRGVPTRLVTVVGQDLFASSFLQHIADLTGDTEGVRVLPAHTTAAYNALLTAAGDITMSVSSMRVFDSFGEDLVAAHSDAVRDALAVVLDANLPVRSMAAVCALCVAHGTPLFIEPTSADKCHKVVQAGCLPAVAVLSPGVRELAAMAASFLPEGTLQDENAQLQAMHSQGVKAVMLHKGPEGVILSTLSSRVAIPATPLTDSILSPSGAGDSLLGCTVAEAVRGCGRGDVCVHDTARLEAAVRVGVRCASLSLVVAPAVNPAIAAL